VTSAKRSQRPAVALFAHDRRRGAGRIAGADEVGRGCLAGPLVAAAVVLDLDAMTPAERRRLGDLDDSKRLRPGVRERLADAIWAIADQVVLVTAGPAAIDRDGLHRTNLRLLASALGQLAPRPAVCLVDGFCLGADAGPHRAVRRGDRTSAAIAAASVVAKVARDRAMAGLARRYPDYGFEEHMGYATARHRDAIVRFGPTPAHRRSFASPAYAAFTARQAAGESAG
jgi:ribonuclease HII